MSWAVQKRRLLLFPRESTFHWILVYRVCLRGVIISGGFETNRQIIEMGWLFEQVLLWIWLLSFFTVYKWGEFGFLCVLDCQCCVPTFVCSLLEKASIVYVIHHLISWFAHSAILLPHLHYMRVHDTSLHIKIDLKC